MAPLSAPPTAHHAFVVTVLEGAERDRQWRVDPVSPNPILIGQSEACDIRLPDRRVSRRHAALEPAGARLRIRDLGSANGTTVDGVP